MKGGMIVTATERDNELTEINVSARERIVGGGRTSIVGGGTREAGVRGLELETNR